MRELFGGRAQLLVAGGDHHPAGRCLAHCTSQFAPLETRRVGHHEHDGTRIGQGRRQSRAGRQGNHAGAVALIRLIRLLRVRVRAQWRSPGSVARWRPMPTSTASSGVLVCTCACTSPWLAVTATESPERGEGRGELVVISGRVERRAVARRSRTSPRRHRPPSWWSGPTGTATTPLPVDASSHSTYSRPLSAPLPASVSASISNCKHQPGRTGIDHAGGVRGWQFIHRGAQRGTGRGDGGDNDRVAVGVRRHGLGALHARPPGPPTGSCPRRAHLRRRTRHRPPPAARSAIEIGLALLRPPAWSTCLRKALRYWETITPELPRAPSSAPRAKAATTSRWLALGGSFATARLPSWSVRYMLVPVSESGTGNTLIASSRPRARLIASAPEPTSGAVHATRLAWVLLS